MEGTSKPHFAAQVEAALSLSDPGRRDSPDETCGVAAVLDSPRGCRYEAAFSKRVTDDQLFAPLETQLADAARRFSPAGEL